MNSHEVRYLVIGGVAAIAHGTNRLTYDLDILIDPTPDNAERLLAALEEAGFGTASLTTPAELLDTEITIFKDRERVDVQTKTPGIEFDAAWSSRQTAVFRGQPFFVLCKDELIASKRAAGRDVDLEDVRLLLLDEGAEKHDAGDKT
ncbi:MAG: DUF6036 family nucleotidyltransferase [Planctomycetota bacterium]